MSLNIFTTMCMLCKTVSTSSLVKLTWKVFCRWGSNLLTTDVALRFMRKKQRTQKTALGTDLANALSRRIHQRRNNLSGVIGYFAYRIQKHVDTGHDEDSNLFSVPTTEEIRKLVKKLVERLDYPK